MLSMRRVGLISSLLLIFTASTFAGQLPKDVSDKVDVIVASIYEIASAKLPCKLSRGARSRMLDWKDVDKCTKQAIERVNWEAVAGQLKELRPSYVGESDFAAAVESSFTRHALPFNQVYRVKNATELLPLTNAALKYLPPDSLMDLPVFIQKGKDPIGTFAGVFSYERTGTLAGGNSYKLSLFQYKDTQGKMQAPSEKLLLDTYGIAWGKIESQPGFRFPIDLVPGINRK
jgi:hypothetical protein